MKIHHYEIKTRYNDLGGFILVEAVFYYLFKDGKILPSFVDIFSSPYKIFVDSPNIIDRIFRITWERKVDRAIKIIKQRAARKVKKDMAAYYLAQKATKVNT